MDNPILDKDHGIQLGAFIVGAILSYGVGFMFFAAMLNASALSESTQKLLILFSLFMLLTGVASTVMAILTSAQIFAYKTAFQILEIQERAHETEDTDDKVQERPQEA